MKHYLKLLFLVGETQLQMSCSTIRSTKITKIKIRKKNKKLNGNYFSFILILSAFIHLLDEIFNFFNICICKAQSKNHIVKQILTRSRQVKML